MIKLDIKKEFDLYIESSIDGIIQLKSYLSEDKIQNECNEDKIMLMLYIRKSLNKVEKKNGNQMESK